MGETQFGVGKSWVPRLASPLFLPRPWTPAYGYRSLWPSGVGEAVVAAPGVWMLVE